MSFYRSDPLGHYKLVMPREDSWHIMNLLGELDMIHFVKSQKLIQNNPYTTQIKRCEQSLRQLNILQKVLFDRGLYTPTQYFTQIQLKQLLKQISQKHQDLNKQKTTSILNQIEDELQQLWNTYGGMKERYETLLKKVQFYRQNIAIIIAGERMFGMQRLTRSSIKSVNGQNYFGEVYQNQGVLRIHYGIIDKSEQGRFQRSIFRISRGHSFVQFIPLSDVFEDVSDAEKTKCIYFLVFQGQKNSYVQKKLLKLTQPYNKAHGKAYQVPLDSDEEKKILKELSKSFNESEYLLKMVESDMQLFLREKLLGYDQRKLKNVNGRGIQQLQKYSKMEMMKIYLLRELQIFTHLREMDVYDNFLQGEIYLRYQDFETLKNRLTTFQIQSRHPSVHIIPIENIPGRSTKKPTLFQRNSYTRSAQDIVQTYGIAKYRQANPSLFTTVTFPFLFGVMFGDIGHGLLLFLFGLIMIWKKYQLADISPFFVMVVPHRYLFAMMGFFSTYCGFIYNDFLSINLNLFGSCYDPTLIGQHQPIPRQDDCIYPFGVDPVWAVAQNNLNYINSLKMKISVIIGVVHMTLGVLIKASNSIYYRRKVQFWFQTVPQLIFLVLVFGYMDFLIIFKWLKPWGYGNPHAPSIITTMINLPLMVGKTDKECCHGGQPMWGNAQFTSQQAIQKAILIIVFLCVPIMLLVKPIYEIKQHKKHEQQIKGNSHGHGHGHHHTKLNTNEQPTEQFQIVEYSMFADQQEDEEVIDNIKSPLSKTPHSNITHWDVRHDVDYPSNENHQPSEIFVHQMIETIQFVLGCISNTASYLRLWALSLAHSQLSEVFMEKTLVGAFEQGYIGIAGVIILLFKMIIFFPLFAGATFGVLMCMDVMECFLHTLRLHWVEFQNKFYKGDGYSFVPFSFLDKINAEIRKDKLQKQPQTKKDD